MDQPVVAMVIVPADGEKFALAPMLKAPFIVKLLAVVTVAEAAIERLLSVSVPEFTIEEPLAMVTVPELALKGVPPLTVNMPEILSAPEALGAVNVVPLARVRSVVVTVPDEPVKIPVPERVRPLLKV